MRTAAQKLGLKPGLRGWVTGGALPGFEAEMAGVPDILLAFAADRAAFEAALPGMLARYARGRALWIAYPKKSGRLTTDLTRDDGWGAALEAGLLPVSQVSIDTDWTAIRLRYRDEIRSLTRKADWPGMA